MPIGSDLLKKIKANDPTLITLDLWKKKLNGKDIRHLINALATNTLLTTMTLTANPIGDKGAMALAANTTLTTLIIESIQIGDEGAIALAANKTLTTLNM